MKLRNFLYLNTKVIEEYVSAIDGYTYDEESQAIATSKESALAGKGAIGIASGTGSHTGKQSEEVKRSVRISNAAKFEKIYKYLQSNEDDQAQITMSFSVNRNIIICTVMIFLKS